MASVTFNSVTYDGLSFTNINLTATGTGLIVPLTNTPQPAIGINSGLQAGLGWLGYSAGAFYANSVEVINFDYTVTSTSASSLIDSASQIYLVDTMFGPGVTLSAVENIYSTTGTLLGTETVSDSLDASCNIITQTINNGQTVALGTPVSLSQAEQSVNIQVTLTMATGSDENAAVAVSQFEQTYGTVPAPPPTAALGDIVFFDSTGSGLETSFNSGPGVAGVTVELLNGTGTSVLATTTTNASGLYNFTGLAAGVYEVQFVSPTGYNFTTQGVGGSADAPINSSADQTTGITGPITLTAGEIDNNVEAGLVKAGSGAGLPASLGSTVWFDANHDGLLDNNEVGVAGVTVELLNGTGTSVLATTTTNASGLYEFTNLTPAAYEVQFVAPSGDTFTRQNVTPTFPGEDNSVANSAGLTPAVTLTAGEVDNNVNSGLVLVTPSVALDKQISTDGTTWVDVGNGNLAQDPSLFVGKTVYERVIVTNTGSVALSGLTVTDVGGNGPAGFAVGSTLAAGASETSAVATITAASGYELDTATVTGTSQDTSGNTTTVTATDQANYTGVSASIALDKQISTDGTTWVDVGNPNLAQDPAVFVGTTLYERVIVTNTGSVALSGLTVIDVGGNGPASFAVGSALAAGASETSAVATITAASGYELDTATVKGTGTDSVGNTGTVTASDQANYTGVSASIALDKQISTNGTTWVDVGNGNLAQDPSLFVGKAVYERVIVTNTGSVALSSLTVTDVGGNGPASFAVGSTLAVGASETSAVATITAASGYELDTATVKGTGTDTSGNTTTVTATDQANYTGVSASIALDKQISTDGSSWVDVGNGNLAQDPAVLVRTTLYERVIVTNTGSVALSNLTVSDVGGNGPASFAVGSTLAVGASETSAVATITAASGYELDTATVKGTGTDSVGNTTTVTASDQANYTGVTAAIALDKQISTDGTTWVDVGNGNLAQDPAVFVGTTLYERVIVTNTGSVALSNLTVTDVGGNGPANFAVGSTLAVGASETSAVATITAASGYELDTATVKGTGTDSVGNTTTVTATDQANYTGTAAPLLCALGDYVWQDLNRNGLQQTGEPGISGVKVSLLAADTLVLKISEDYYLANAQYTVTVNGQQIGGTYTATASHAAGQDNIVTLQGDFGTNPTVVVTFLNDAYNGSTSTDRNLYVDNITYNNVVENKSATLLSSGSQSLSLTGAGGSVLATTTTNSSGLYHFTGLQPGSYEVAFTAPSGESFTTQYSGTNTAIDSNANQTTGVTDVVTLTAGQTDNTIDAGLVQSGGLTVLKQPCSLVVNQCGQVTYSFSVTNSGTAPLNKVKLTDNIGSATNPDNVTPAAVTSGGFNVGDANHNGVLDSGETWQYTETVSQINCTPGGSGSVCHTASGSNLSSGCTAWLHSTFNPTSCADGATYKFQGIQCTISGHGVGSNPITVGCPDSEVVFSKNCKSATTVYNASNNCWVTTLPANCNPGSVFLSGVPLTIPSGCNLSGSSVTWSIGDASNNCGTSSLTWDSDCTGYQNFNCNGLNGSTDYNQIGVKSCDSQSGYGNGGDCDTGYGYNGSSYCDTGYNSNGGGCGGYGNGGYGNGYGNSWNTHGWQGSGDDNCGTPENQYVNNNCGNTNDCDSYSQSCGGWGGWYNCGGNSGASGSCGGSGSSSQNQGNITGAADTVTVTATTSANTTITATDTKEVQILGCNSNISVNGTAPTGSLSSLYGTAQTLELTYTPGNTVSLKQVQAGVATVTGTNSSSLAFMEVSNNANPFASGASIYFQGEVTSGEKIFADATTNVLTNTPIAGGHFSTTAGADIYAYVFTSQQAFQSGAAPVQTMAYNTSGSQAMHIGDTIGSMSVIGYVGAKGGHLSS